MPKLPTFKLKTRMIIVLGLMTVVQTGVIGCVAMQTLFRSLDEQIGQRALDVAKTIAALPDVVAAVERRDTAYLVPLSLALAEQTQARFIVIGDRVGVRLAHPRAEMIGLSMADDDGEDNTPALRYGQAYVTKAEGSMGWSMRGKAPIFDRYGETVVGIVSVGFRLAKVEMTITRYSLTLVLVILLSFGISALIAVWFAQHFKQAIFGLEPEQIARLFSEQHATLESVKEGIIAINAAGYITTINRTAITTLGLPASGTYTGRLIDDVLPDSAMLEVLASGEPQYDREVCRGERIIIANRIPLCQGGRVTGVVSSFRPKDELAEVSRKLTRIQQYADSLRSQSHEYANKLHTIAGLIQLGATDEALALIGQEAQAHQALIQLLLHAVPDPILSGCLLGKYNRAKEMGLLLEIDPESQMVALPEHIRSDELVTVLGNLLDNALEATLTHHGKGGSVFLSMTDIGNDLVFEVEDQGGGIAATEHDRIFDKGVSSKPTQGHGYGLHLVKRTLDERQGSIMLEPTEQGTRFTVYLPKNTPNT